MSSTATNDQTSYIKGFLEGELPYQSAVYVTILPKRKQVHVMPVNTGGRYTIANAQYNWSYEYPPETQEYIKKVCTDLQALTLYDKSGFYMGVRATDIGIFDFVTPDRRMDYAWRDIMTPYTRYTFPEDNVHSILGEVPVVADLTFGTVPYGPYQLEQLDKLGVSVNNVMVQDHMIFKIDQTAFLHETEFPDKYVLIEDPLSAQWNRDLHTTITTNAIDLIKLLLNLNPKNPWDRINKKITDTISQATNPISPWPVTTHDLDEIL